MRLTTGELVVLLVFSILTGPGWWLVGAALGDLSLVVFATGAAMLLAAVSLLIVTTSVDTRGAVPLLMVAVHVVCAFAFALGISLFGAIVAVVSFVFGSIAVWRMHHGRDDSLMFRLRDVTSRGLMFWMWAVGVVVGMGIFLNIPSREELLIVVPAKIVDFSFPAIAQAVGPATGIAVDTTIEDLFRQLDKTNDPRVLEEQQKQLSRNVGLEVRGDMTVRELLSAVLARQFRPLMSLFGDALAVGFVVIFIFIFQFLALPAQLLLALTNPVVLQLLRWGGLVMDREETVVRKM